MNRRLRPFVLAIVAALSLLASLRFSAPALGQQPGATMDRSGVPDIRNDQERSVFSHLLCTCGCPRESISTCTCGFADGFRSEVRTMIGKGMTLEQIEAEWVRQHGTQALTVPPNTGGSQFVYLVPLGAIAGMAAVVITALRRFRKKGDEVDATNKKKTEREGLALKGAPDAYDEKLDEELKRLDEE
ncbi:MAG: cytochrome c-type biogenesis protein CcmH [Minicystis sp.]